MSEQLSQVRDVEAPAPDAFEQALPVDDQPEIDLPVKVLSGDLEVPEPDAIEQHLPAPVDDDDNWR